MSTEPHPHLEEEYRLAIKADGARAAANITEIIVGSVRKAIESGKLDKVAAPKAGTVTLTPTAIAKKGDVNVFKVDESAGLVLGWAIICMESDKPYFDTQGDHIPEESMLKAATDFMLNSRILGDMHQTAEGGSVVFSMPWTADIASAFGYPNTTKTGLMIGVKPATEETLEKFRNGTYTGFSIGGVRVDDDPVEEA
jgi:hypothetical protein